MKQDFEVYKRLFRYIIPYKWSLIVSFTLLGIASIAHSGISVVTYITINGLINRDVVSFKGIPNLPEWMSSVTFSAAWVPAIIVLVFVIRGISEYFSKYIMATAGLRSLMDIRNDLYKRILSLSSRFHGTARAGDLISRIMNDVSSINAAITTIVADCIKGPLEILFSIPLIFILGGNLAWYAVAVFPLVAIPIALLGKRMRKLSRQSMERNADITSFLDETIFGMRIIKAFAMEKHEGERFRVISKAVFDYSRRILRVVESQRPIIEIMGAVGIALTISYSMKTLSADRFIAFAASLFLLYEPFKKISKVNAVLQQALASGVRIFAIMDTPQDIVEVAKPHELTRDIKTVRFEHVTFGYEPSQLVLKDFDLTVAHGEAIAFVGSSGAGKTTVTNLLMRFYDPLSGTVSINDVNVKEYSLASLRGNMGLVTQETILFSGTVAENIAYGKPNATREEIEQAARAAYAHDFIMTKLENGYDSQVGDRGILLSGGQRQRLCIARAILKNPPILIFDEATSQLDSESEREVQLAVENLMRGRTVFVIAHRLSTIQNSTKILVLDHGVVVEQGDHKSLLKANGMYKKFYDLQFREE